jgi:hypothetical protein
MFERVSLARTISNLEAIVCEQAHVASGRRLLEWRNSGWENGIALFSELLRKLRLDRRSAAGLSAGAFRRFTETPNRSTCLFCAIPDGKPLHTFPGIALIRWFSRCGSHGQ